MDAVLEAPLPALQPSLGPEALPSPQTSAPFLNATDRQAGFPRCGTLRNTLLAGLRAICAWQHVGALLACERWCKLSRASGLPCAGVPRVTRPLSSSLARAVALGGQVRLGAPLDVTGELAPAVAFGQSACATWLLRKRLWRGACLSLCAVSGKQAALQKVHEISVYWWVRVTVLVAPLLVIFQSYLI